jgi:hypothetical protein
MSHHGAMRSEHEHPKQRHTRSGVEPPLPEGVTPSASKLRRRESRPNGR